VRVALWMPHGSVDATLKILRDEVLESIRFLVDFIPRVAKRLHQPGFDQAVMADDLQRGFLSLFG
jgi:hypothetical protein